MVIKPTNMALWENMQRLDQMFKDTGLKCLFPLFIQSLFIQRGQHGRRICRGAVIASRLAVGGGVKGAIFPIRRRINCAFQNNYLGYLQINLSWSAILANQWANVVRWEMRTRLFFALCTWQEGHTAMPPNRAIDETLQMLEVYRTFAGIWQCQL